MSNDQNNQLVNIHGLARILGLPVSWLATEAKDGRIPCLHAGGKMLFNAEAVELALAERAAAAPYEPGPRPDGEGAAE